MQPVKKRPPLKALLINPSNQRRVVRDCFCSDIVKADYYWHPMDLVVQSALLAPHAEVYLIDAIASGMEQASTMQFVKEAAPDIVLCLVGDVVKDDDLAFCLNLRKALPGAVMIGSGDIFLEEPEKALGLFEPLDGALLDFTSEQLAQMAQGETPTHDMVLRHEGSIERLPNLGSERFSYPIPPKQLFEADLYRLPFYGGNPFYSLLASYGCPYACRFCHVPSLGYKSRAPDEVLEELKAAVHRGFRNIYFRDATFGVRREDVIDLCERIISEGLDIRWNCFTHIGLLDKTLLGAMARAGCAIVQLGVETLDRDVCIAAGKNYNQEILRQIIEDCRRAGILTSLHFVIGLLGDSWITSKRAAKDIIELNPDYVSINILHPRPGTAMKREGIRLSRQEIKRFKRIARTLNLRFYLRPGRVAAELARLENLRNVLRSAHLARSMLLPSD